MTTRPYNPRISISRADYVGHWQDFLANNAPFISDREIERIELALKHTGTATHVAGGAGEFVLEVVK